MWFSNMFELDFTASIIDNIFRVLNCVVWVYAAWTLGNKVANRIKEIRAKHAEKAETKSY